MCTYCMLADWMHLFVPYQPVAEPQPWSPWNQWPNPTGAAPVTLPLPITVPSQTTWTRQQFDMAWDILQRIKVMEEKLGDCPCEDPSKMNFLKDIERSLNESEHAKPTGDTDSVSC